MKVGGQQFNMAGTFKVEKPEAVVERRTFGDILVVEDDGEQKEANKAQRLKKKMPEPSDSSSLMLPEFKPKKKKKAKHTLESESDSEATPLDPRASALEKDRQD